MGCDIHVYAEKKGQSGEFEPVDDLSVFEDRNYGAFGFLANVRNYSAIAPISSLRGVPADASDETKEAYRDWDCDAHSASWLSVSELVDFDYEAKCEDRRCTIQIGPKCWDGGGTCEPGAGKTQTYRQFLGDGFMDDVQALKDSGADRIVFWFDN